MYLKNETITDAVEIYIFNFTTSCTLKVYDTRSTSILYNNFYRFMFHAAFLLFKNTHTRKSCGD